MPVARCALMLTTRNFRKFKSSYHTENEERMEATGLPAQARQERLEFSRSRISENDIDEMAVNVTEISSDKNQTLKTHAGH